MAIILNLILEEELEETDDIEVTPADSENNFTANKGFNNDVAATSEGEVTEYKAPAGPTDLERADA
jgi:hypothetical protein